LSGNDRTLDENVAVWNGNDRISNKKIVVSNGNDRTLDENVAVWNGNDRVSSRNGAVLSRSDAFGTLRDRVLNEKLSA